MKYFLLLTFFACLSFSKLHAQGELLKLTAEVLTASDELEGSLEKMESLKDALKEIEDKKTPKFIDNEWSKLASTYKEAAMEINKAPLPTDFDKEKYSVSLDELKNCDLKDATLRKLNDYLQELKNAQERGRQSIITINGISAKIKISRELLRYCIDLHEKLGQVPIFGEKFLWDWVELQGDVTEALNIFEAALKNQRNKIITEKSKIDVYIPNFESNLFHINKYFNDNCKNATGSKKQPTNNKKVELESRPATESDKNENSTSHAGYYVFFTADVYINNKFTNIISKPIAYNGQPSDITIYDKNNFIDQIKKQSSNQDDTKKEQLMEAIHVHYGKPNSTNLLKNKEEVVEAIEAYKQSLSDAISGLEGADPINFFQLK